MASRLLRQGGSIFAPMARRRGTKIDEATKARWAEQARAYMERVAANPGSVAVRPACPVASSQPSNGAGFVQMCTVQNLAPSIAAPLTALQRDMLWAAWQGDLWRDRRGVSIAGHRASIVTLRALRLRGLVEKGGGQIGITRDGLVALELLYTDPREWSTAIEAVTGSLPQGGRFLGLNPHLV